MKEMSVQTYLHALEYVQAGCLVFFPPRKDEDVCFYWMMIQVRDCSDLWHHEPWRRQAAITHCCKKITKLIEAETP